MINIAILGFGVVGSGTAEVLTENKAVIEERLGCEYNIKYILDLREFPDSPFASKIVHDFNIILNDPEITVVAEMMGGSHPAYDFTKACLEAGKSVVTSNKEVVSTFGVELCSIAAKNNARYLFEASVGGGIPVIRPMTHDLTSNKINKISGILNGTTNYILTSMRDNGASFADALSEAQKLGYAEANPSADVDGIDAARKITILAALASGKLADPKKIHTEGITAITSEDTEIAKEMGYTIKLIGYSELVDGKFIAFVSPRMVPVSNPLSSIDGVFNGILINANMVGNVMFYGPGAGKLPTASAVVADIIDIIAGLDKEPENYNWTAASLDDMLSMDNYSCRRFFVFKDALPQELKASAFYKNNGLSACVTVSEMTETEVKAICDKYADKLVSAYRVL